jgi:hypothetical protein
MWWARMKKIFALFAMVFVVAACNLSSKLKSNSNSSNSGSSESPGSSGGEAAEKPHPTAAQEAALAGGQSASWDQQGITWTLPPGWKKNSDTADTIVFGSGTEAFLIANISAYGPDFPTDISLRGFHQGAKVREKNGQVDELKWLELDGVKGVQFRESKPQMDDDIRRLQWITYRKFGGQVQMVNFILSSRGDNFEKHKDELYAILYSTKLVH